MYRCLPLQCPVFGRFVSAVCPRFFGCLCLETCAGIDPSLLRPAVAWPGRVCACSGSIPFLGSLLIQMGDAAELWACLPPVSRLCTLVLECVFSFPSVLLVDSSLNLLKRLLRALCEGSTLPLSSLVEEVQRVLREGDGSRGGDASPCFQDVCADTLRNLIPVLLSRRRLGRIRTQPTGFPPLDTKRE